MVEFQFNSKSVSRASAFPLDPDSPGRKNLKSVSFNIATAFFTASEKTPCGAFYQLKYESFVQGFRACS